MIQPSQGVLRIRVRLRSGGLFNHRLRRISKADRQTVIDIHQADRDRQIHQFPLLEARFDNELLGDTSTLGAEVSKMIEGLQTGNAALVSAAADQMHANSADVGGNNIPVNGGTYNPDGLTVADVLSTAGAPAAVAAATAPGDAVPVAPAAAAPAVVATAAATTVAADTGTHDHAPAAVEIHEPAFADSAHHFHHMWG
jgi:hypothetical protein